MAIAEPFHRVWLGFGGLHGHRGTIPSRMAKFGGLCGRRGTVPSLLALIKVIYSYFWQEFPLLPTTIYLIFYFFKGYTTSLAYFKGPNAAITMLHIY